MPAAIADDSGGGAAAGRSGASDLTSALWGALLAAGSAAAGDAFKESLDAAAAVAAKLQPYFQPPPEGFPPGPPGDQSAALLSDPLAFIESLRHAHGPVAGMLLGGERVVLISSAEAAREVLINRPDVFVKEGTAFFPGSALTGNGLLVSDGAVWRRQRRMANPAFRRAAVDTYAARMADEAQRLLRGPLADAAAAAAAPQAGSWGLGWASGAQGGAVDVYQEFNKLTLNITLSALFGISTDYGSDGSSVGGGGSGALAARVVAAVERAFAFFAGRGAAAMVVPEWVPTPDNLEFSRAVAELDELVYGIIYRRREELAAQRRQQGGPQEHPLGGGQQQQRHQQQWQQQEEGKRQGAPDLLQALLEAVDDDGSVLTDQALRDEAMTLLVAGQETSAILLGWAAALLAHHPEAQEQAAAEVAALRLPPGVPPTASDLPHLPRVAAVALEALRLYSPAYMVGRCANTDAQLPGGYFLPKGTTVLVSPYLMHRDPDYWREPLRFDPSRWLESMPPAAPAASSGAPSAHAAAAGCPAAAAAAAVDASRSGGNGGSPSGSPPPPQQQQQDGQAAAAAESSSDGGPSPSSGSAGGGGGYVFAAALKDMGPNGAYVPFGGGPRNCIGTGFAMVEAVLVLAALLQRYELAPAPGAGFPRPKALLTLRPDGVPLRVLTRRGGR